MQVIRVIEHKRNLDFLQFLSDNLSKRYLVLVSYHGEASYFYNAGDTQKPVLTLLFTPSLEDIRDTNTIVFLKDFSISEHINVINKSSTLICAEDYVSLLRPIAHHSPTIYTCGYRSRNHIGISSIRETDASISLLRSIMSLDGRVIEPAEYVLENTVYLNDIEILGSTLIFLIVGVL